MRTGKQLTIKDIQNIGSISRSVSQLGKIGFSEDENIGLGLKKGLSTKSGRKPLGA